MNFYQPGVGSITQRWVPAIDWSSGHALWTCRPVWGLCDFTSGIHLVILHSFFFSHVMTNILSQAGEYCLVSHRRNDPRCGSGANYASFRGHCHHVRTWLPTSIPWYVKQLLMCLSTYSHLRFIRCSPYSGKYSPSTSPDGRSRERMGTIRKLPTNN